MNTDNQSDHILISDSPEFRNAEHFLSRSNQSFLTFHQGEPKWSKLAGVESENRCHSLVRTEFALGLICRNIVYLLDPATYARQYMHNFAHPVLEFTTFDDKILLVTQNTDPDLSSCSVALYLLDSFDQSLVLLPCLPEGFLKQGALRAKHVRSASKQSYLLFYEEPIHTSTYSRMPNNPKIYFMSICKRGLVNNKVPSFTVDVRNLSTADGSRIISDAEANVTILEVFTQDTRVWVFYQRDSTSNNSVEGVTVAVDQSADGLRLLTDDGSRPLSFGSADGNDDTRRGLPTRFRTDCAVWGIPETNLFAFYQLTTAELILCKIDNDRYLEPAKVQNCSNIYKVWLEDRDLGLVRIHEFARTIYLPESNRWMFHMEVKARTDRNHTAYSTLFEFKESDMTLKEITYWKVGGSNYHYLQTSANESDMSQYYKKQAGNQRPKQPRNTDSTFELVFWRPINPRLMVSALSATEISDPAVVDIKVSSGAALIESKIAIDRANSSSLLQTVEWTSNTSSIWESLIQGESDDQVFKLTTDETLSPTVLDSDGAPVKLPRFTEELHHLHFQLVKKSEYSSSSAFCYACEPKPAQVYEHVKIRPKLDFVGNLIKPDIWSSGVLGWNAVVQVADFVFILSSCSREHKITSRLSVLQTNQKIPESRSGDDFKQAYFGLQSLHEEDFSQSYCNQMDVEQTPYKDNSSLLVVEIACMVRGTAFNEFLYTWIHLEFVRTSDGKISVLKPVNKKNHLLNEIWQTEMVSLQFGFTRKELFTDSVLYSDILFGISLVEFHHNTFLVSVQGLRGLEPHYNQTIEDAVYEIKAYSEHDKMKTLRMLNFMDPQTNSSTDIVFVGLSEDNLLYYSNDLLFHVNLLTDAIFSKIDWREASTSQMKFDSMNCANHKAMVDGREQFFCYAKVFRVPLIYLFKVHTDWSGSLRQVSFEIHGTYEIPHNFTLNRIDLTSSTFLTVDGILHTSKEHIYLQLLYEIGEPTNKTRGVSASLLKTYSMEHSYGLDNSKLAPKYKPGVLVDFDDSQVAFSYEVIFARNQSRQRVFLSSSDGTANTANIYFMHEDVALIVNNSMKVNNTNARRRNPEELSKILSEYQLEVNFGHVIDLVKTQPEPGPQNTLLRNLIILALVCTTICLCTCLVYLKVKRDAKLRDERDSAVYRDTPADSFYSQWPAGMVPKDT